MAWRDAWPVKLSIWVEVCWLEQNRITWLNSVLMPSLNGSLAWWTSCRCKSSCEPSDVLNGGSVNCFNGVLVVALKNGLRSACLVDESFSALLAHTYWQILKKERFNYSHSRMCANIDACEDSNRAARLLLCRHACEVYLNNRFAILNGWMWWMFACCLNT